MNLSILIEESSRDRSVKLTLQEAKCLYLELGTLLNGMVMTTVPNPFLESLLTPIGGNGYEAPDPNPNVKIHYWDCQLDTDHKGECRNAEALKAEESPETLRETKRCLPGCGGTQL